MQNILSLILFLSLTLIAKTSQAALLWDIVGKYEGTITHAGKLPVEAKLVLRYPDYTGYTAHVSEAATPDEGLSFGWIKLDERRGGLMLGKCDEKVRGSCSLDPVIGVCKVSFPQITCIGYSEAEGLVWQAEFRCKKLRPFEPIDRPRCEP